MSNSHNTKGKDDLFTKMTSLTSLAEEALEHAKALDAYLASQALPSTSFEVDSLATLPLDLTHHRDGLINSSQALKQLAQGPSGVLTELVWACTDEISLGAIYDYQLAKVVPLEGSATFAEIARASGRLSEDLVERFLRHAMGNHIFTEDPPGFVKHTASSRLLATDPELNDLIGFRLRESWQVSSIYGLVHFFHAAAIIKRRILGIINPSSEP